jgi:hypothetical protein
MNLVIGYGLTVAITKYDKITATATPIRIKTEFAIFTLTKKLEKHNILFFVQHHTSSTNLIPKMPGETYW